MTIDIAELKKMRGEDEKFINESRDYVLSKLDKTKAYEFDEINNIMREFLKERGEKPTEYKVMGLRILAIYGKEAVLDSKTIKGKGYAFVKGAWNNDTTH